MKATVKWVDNVMFLGESGSGHTAVMDGSPDHGGRNMGIRPMEMLLLGLGGCASFDVIGILKKGRQNISDCRVEITAERADTTPSVFTKINMAFIVTGRDLKEKQVSKAVALSADKYCSASKLMVDAGVIVTYSTQIVETDET